MADEPEEKAPSPPKSKRKLLGLSVILILVVAAGVTGTLFGPRMLGAGADGPVPSASGEPEEPKEEKNFASMKFEPLVLDVRDRDNNLHHIRVGLTAELKPTVAKEEFDKLQPRGREVAIIYMRSWKFEDLTDPAQFERISGELSERMRKAMGQETVTRILVSDYVAQ